MAAGIDWLWSLIATCPAIPIFPSIAPSTNSWANSFDELRLRYASEVLFPGALHLSWVGIPELDVHRHRIQIWRFGRREVIGLHLQHNIEIIHLHDSPGAHGNQRKSRRPEPAYRVLRFILRIIRRIRRYQQDVGVNGVQQVCHGSLPGRDLGIALWALGNN